MATTDKYAQLREKAVTLYDEGKQEEACALFQQAIDDGDLKSALFMCYAKTQEEDIKAARQYWMTAQNFYKQMGKPTDDEDLLILFGNACAALGDAQYEKAPYLALINYLEAYSFGNTRCCYNLGNLIYKGYGSPTGESEPERALEYWKAGMEAGWDDSIQAYHEHLIEQIPEPVDSKEKTYDNGDVYHGDLDGDGLPHGTGTMTYKKQSGRYPYKLMGDGLGLVEYYGQWHHGKRQGHGTYTFKNGDTYEGEWVSGLREGCGKYTKANGDSYTGVWKAGDIVSIDGDQQLRLKIELYHSGFDYNNTFKGMLEVTKARRYTIGNMSIIRRDKGFNDANELLEITAISQDSIDLIVPEKYCAERPTHPVAATVKRGETLTIEDVKEDTATIYDDDYDFEIIRRITIQFL